VGISNFQILWKDFQRNKKDNVPLLPLLPLLPILYEYHMLV
jgi:hypothetical protein